MRGVGQSSAWALSLVLGMTSASWGQTPGSLSQSAGVDGCIAQTDLGGQCTDGRGLDNPIGVTVSPDGKHVYVVSDGSDAVAVLTRNKVTGALTQAAGLVGCISETGSESCTNGVGLDNADDVEVSKDGKHVYVASFVSNAVAVFARNKTTGKLTQLGGLDDCISETGDGGTCVNGKALNGAVSVAISKDGKHVYATSLYSNAVAVLKRQK